ncbi:MAG: sensor domain-containing diguanylate cyclase [Actinobacteria bacterium]|nr:sensor domain-containing diguanylate cyclase [Actinomycetota bacterium]
MARASAEIQRSGDSEFYAGLVDLASEFLCVLRRDGTMAMANPAWRRFLGFPPESFDSLSVLDLIHPDDLERIIPPAAVSDAALSAEGIVGRVRCADGEYRPVSWRLLPAPEPGLMYMLGQDVSRPGSAAALGAELDQLHLDLTALGEMRDNLDLCLTIEEGCQVIARFCHEAMNGWPGEVWIVNSSRNLLERIASWGPGVEDPQAVVMMEFTDCWAMRGGRRYAIDRKGSELRCKHLPPGPERSLCTPLKGPGEPFGLLTTWGSASSGDPSWSSYLRRTDAVAEVLSMGLANLMLRESLRSQSIRDPLTGLFNRRFMDETFDRELARAQRHESTIGVIVIDVDNFKQFNGEFGHRAGDSALIELAAVLAKSTRTEDVACRMGGEEFGVIIPGVPLAVAAQRAGAIADAVREITVMGEDGERLGQITVSMGVSAYPDHGRTRETLVAAADVALFEAKHNGRDRVCVAESTSDPPTPGSA